MTLVDLLIISLVIAALLRGRELGFVRQFFSTVGFFGGLLLGVVLIPYIIGLVHTQVSRAIVTLSLTVGLGLLMLLFGELIGMLLKQRLVFVRLLNRVDNSAGAVIAGLSFVAMVWLSAAALVTLPYAGLQSAIRGSAIISFLDQHLPPAPGIIADIGHLIDPNGFPDVFIGSEPSPSSVAQPTPAALAAAVTKDRPSIVKIEGQGCGGIVEGSGFVAGNGIVVTDAHVIAGIRNPYIIDQAGTHKATPIWFDPDVDFAVLRTSGLAGQPLPLKTQSVSSGTPGGVLGYPGGGSFEADSAAVIQEFTAVGRNIYNEGRSERDVYSIKANVVPGNSGGPLIDTDGNVIGIVFAASTEYNDVGYALSIYQVTGAINQAQTLNQAVDAGNCAQ